MTNSRMFVPWVVTVLMTMAMSGCGRAGKKPEEALRNFLRPSLSYGMNDDGRSALQQVLLLRSKEGSAFALLADQNPPVANVGKAELCLVDADNKKEWIVRRLVIFGIADRSLFVKAVSGNRMLRSAPSMNADLERQQAVEWDRMLKSWGFTISEIEQAKSQIPF